jgi:hypothetical protein
VIGFFPEERMMAMPENDTHMAEALYVSRSRTYRGFLHMTRWFVIHAALILFGLLLFSFQEGASGGFIFIAAGVAALAYGMGTTARAVAKPVPNPRATERLQPYRQAAE